MSISLPSYEIWFITGSQHLYGLEVLEQVKAHSQEVADSISRGISAPVEVRFKALLTTPDEILALCREASASPSCIGLIAWMHTFSPAKMWINGLKILSKPLLHFHTQYHRDIPWSSIDMDYMNMHQSAHGGREFGHLLTRMGIQRKVVVGHWKDEESLQEIDTWSRAAMGWQELQQT